MVSSYIMHIQFLRKKKSSKVVVKNSGFFALKCTDHLGMQRTQKILFLDPRLNNKSSSYVRFYWFQSTAVSRRIENQHFELKCKNVTEGAISSMCIQSSLCFGQFVYKEKLYFVLILAPWPPSIFWFKYAYFSVY